MARLGRQTPTQSVIVPYSVTHGAEAIDLYNSTGTMPTIEHAKKPFKMFKAVVLMFALPL